MGTCEWLYKQKLDEHVPPKLKTVQNLVDFSWVDVVVIILIISSSNWKTNTYVSEPDDMDRAVF
jgi:hypothetical protein